MGLRVEALKPSKQMEQMESDILLRVKKRVKCEKVKRKEINFFSFNTNPNRDRDGLTELNQSRDM